MADEVIARTSVISTDLEILLAGKPLPAETASKYKKLLHMSKERAKFDNANKTAAK